MVMGYLRPVRAHWSTHAWYSRDSFGLGAGFVWAYRGTVQAGWGFHLHVGPFVVTVNRYIPWPGDDHDT